MSTAIPVTAEGGDGLCDLLDLCLSRVSFTILVSVELLRPGAFGRMELRNTWCDCLRLGVLFKLVKQWCSDAGESPSLLGRQPIINAQITITKCL